MLLQGSERCPEVDLPRPCRAVQCKIEQLTRSALLLLQMVTVWAQCGGMYGGDRCMSKPDGAARCDDAAWSWVRCPAASACKRLNYGFWQCTPA